MKTDKQKKKQDTQMCKLYILFYNNLLYTPVCSNTLCLRTCVYNVRWLRHWVLLLSKRWGGVAERVSTSPLLRWSDVNNTGQEAEGSEACLDFWKAFSAFISLCSASNHPSIQSTPPSLSKTPLADLLSGPRGTVFGCVHVCVCVWWVDGGTERICHLQMT